MPYNPNAIWTSKKKTYGPANVPQANTPPSGDLSRPQPQPQSESQPENQPPTPRGPSFFHRHALLFFSVGILLLLGIALGVAFLLRAPAKPSVTIAFSEPSTIPVGAPTAITISSTNNSTSQLTGAVLTVTLPSGMSFVGDDPSEQAKEYPLGTINPGAVVAQSSTIIITGQPESLQRVNVELTYNTPATAQTQYETDSETNIVAGDAAISLSYSATPNIVSGQSFSFTVNYQNNTAQDIDNVSIQAAYPPAFVFATSSIPTAGNDDSWNIGTIAANTSGSFTVTGTIVGPTQAQYQMSGTVLLGIDEQNYPVNERALSFVVTQPPLALTIVPNSSSTYVSFAGDTLDYILTYTNNSSVNFASVNITANLVGQMFDFPSLQTAGAFSSRTNTITWTAANTPALASVAPGQSGTVSFTVKTNTSFPIRLPSDKNYVLNVTGTIQSPTVPPNTAGSSTVAVVAQQNKLGGAITLAAIGGLASGTYPPVVNQETDYAIHWKVTNYSTDAQNVTVSGYLQSGTTLTGTITSNISSTPVYDSGTGLISWTIPVIPAGTGIINQPVEATLDVSNVPAVNEVGNDVTLLGQSSLTATDAFTGQALQASADPITSALHGDPNIPQGEDTSVSQ